MAEQMNIQIRIIFPDDENITLPVDNNEKFQDFQSRVLQTHGLSLQKEYFTFDSNVIQDTDNIGQFLNTFNDLEGQTDIIYEIRLQNVDETVKNQQIETNEALLTFKEDDPSNPSMININPETENPVLNVLQENIFENNETSETNIQLIEENNTNLNGIKFINIGSITENNVENNNTMETADQGRQQIYNYMDIESKLREIHDTTEELATELCRLCAKNVKNDDKVKVYNDGERFDEKINMFLPIKVDENDGLPQQICKECLLLLKSFTDFCQTIQQADKVLRLKFLPSNTSFKEKTLQKFTPDPNKQTSFEKQYQSCRFCQMIIPEINTAVTHSLNAHSNISGLNVCVLCDFGFTSMNLLKQHVYENHKKLFKIPKNQCKVCQQEFQTQSILEKHICNREQKKQMMLHCEICNQVFLSKLRLNFHRQFHLRSKYSLYCVECKLTFNDENDHFNHVSCFHNLKQIFVCDICEKTFSKTATLNSHKEIHLNEYKCELCQKVFVTEEALKDHETVHKDTKRFTCETCNKNFIRTSHLRKHTLTHEINPIVDDVHICSICKQCLKDKDEGKSHEKNKHSGVECVEIVGTDRVFNCEFCDDCYVTTESLKTHKYFHKETESYNCQICKMHFSTLSKCLSHQMTHAPQPEELKMDEYPVEKHFLCEYCGRSYTNWNNLNLHRRLKHPEKFEIYNCQDCNGQFCTLANYNLHRKTFHSNESFKCEDCGKSLSNLKSLQVHKATQHSNGKELTCNICNKTFGYQVSLDAHMKTHCKTFKCTYCSKSFINNLGLLNHIKVHRDNHKICLHCGQKFQTAYECNVHERVHKKSISCEICDKEFTTKTQLLEHSKIHLNKNRLFYCDICGACFKKAVSLKSHKSKHYKDKSLGSFVLMVDMKDEVQEKNNQTETIAQTTSTVTNTTGLLTTQNTTLIDPNTTTMLSDNYIDIGNGQYLKVQGNSVNIDGRDYLLIDQNGKTVNQNQELQMVVDDNFAENTIATQELNNSMLLAENQNQIILNENQVNQQEFVFTTEDVIGKPGTTYVIDGNHFILGSDDQVTF